ncbi:MAG: PP2C family protein-serine/threonine phosphatase [Paludisphaera borealis]|uniref:PP2C family protein-serine/threonine phosphatase n=1 Tax=Paludisphaera borealis TaxID=1387353 RepID=UPI00283E38F7|nr:PP2C family protein-serine/threonine phosphatase [Paludisphaera borealis]MDR3621393.1 PP2C family protein-serine/threonine phosphatase [Paludisphaera borealis]
MDSSPEKPCLNPMRCMEIRGGNRAVEESFQTPGLDAWLYSLPFENSVRGGDLHYVSVCGGGVITRLVVADVSGHGEQVAEFSDALRSMMWKNINTKSQTRLVEALNRQFGETAQLLRFATAVVATYLATKRTLTICNAGHPRPLWHQAATGRWGLLDKEFAGAGNLPLGLDDDSPYNQFTVTLGAGDVLLFYTDALTEAMDASGRLLGEDGLLEIARGLDLSDPHRIAPALLAAIGRHRSGRPADDDVTLLTVYHNARGPRRMSLAAKLDVYAKLLGLRSPRAPR